MKKELLIFGSSGALGEGVTKVLIEKNYDRIYLFDFKHKNMAQTNVKQITVEDLSVEENVKKAFNEIEPSKEKIFFLFSTIGGFTGGKKIWETETGDFDRMINMNLKISFLIAKYFSLLVKKSHSGSICLTSAYTGLVPESGKAVYGTSKAALIYLIKTLAEEGKDINLSANAIAPFIIDTPANREWMKDADFSEWIKPSEIGDFVESIFQNYNLLTGNIYQLKYRFDKD
ncbi:MAG: SDR family NAD(P)-dependent oxidoreductase [Ignavibacteriaceae bacterium]|nr:SDR family NAD(P)-dependent oxidoreductase [Ignavibacteriaceae bacterium]